MRHGEFHKVHHIGWLRASVLGANDGIISTASLIMGVAAAQAELQVVLLTGIAGLVAGAVSMAAGEYVSVRSQADTETADLARERAELEAEPEAELRELTEIYVKRGIDRELAYKVAAQLTAHDALGSHARDELGIIDFMAARPLQAAVSSAATFAVGALIPLMIVVLAAQNIFISRDFLIPATVIVSLLALALLGGLAAKVGGANLLQGSIRVVLWGALAMLMTGVVGHFFGVVA
ncbi:MAG: VIT family protein [Pseudomonadota bacterium]